MAFLNNVTPVILTYNEEVNIGRVLDRLTWARDIVVVDSGSTDATRALCEAHPKVRLFTRPFDSHAGQWTYAVHETAIATDWFMALDADYILTTEAQREIDALSPATPHRGFWLSFRYAILGKTLKSGIYPPVLALLRRDGVRYVQDGHAMRAQVEGSTGRIAAPLIHDDRKSFDRWLASQITYARLEAEKNHDDDRRFRTWLRTRTPFAPLIVGAHVLFVRGALFEGYAGWFYALQRMLAEALGGCVRWDRRLRGGG